MRDSGNKLRWVCQCVCGNIRLVYPANLKRRSGSCGCRKSERISAKVKKHGATLSRTWGIWRHMRDRCNSPQNRDYARYGAKGIKVCDRWEGPQGFQNFLADMGDPGNDSLLTIDRIDGRLGYSKQNCRWATMKSQQRNRKDNRLLTCNGVTRVLAEWAEVTGIRRDTITHRIDRYGWSVEKALTTPTKELQ